ncbi:UDP-3-O-(3-hydroxymyristoyl)glucosamine N-acyltransferase [Lewinella sp. W8]|uniref:UDP-3-O-(3-hydroxymyristoyl)glucosamine N-acyltransferase n=1 Tax=Lewinella sp. W8 TaxID=2528208 RepID=UPI0010674899|nr:UDP-3-O-(3-hydroxymyristoyl)glucosamine N-acyltransferase [Lewinella sp. W8]MTB52432.1 UDP-3-O-(3-hydroxymyristoyl)glucosamine N-acyltransferase [Lewinella sp. W8]
MRIARPLTAAQLAEKIGADLVGDGEQLITGLNEVHHVEAGDLSFVDHPRYYDAALQSAATVILIDQKRECPPGKALLIVREPFRHYNDLVWQERPMRPWSDHVDPTARLGRNVSIAPGAIVGANAIIGDNCQIGPNAVIGERCELGRGVIVGPGAVIGGEAFYYKRTSEGMTPWRSGGNVILEDEVEIGPNCTIARGVSSSTTVGKGTKMDAMVQIGHDCRIGQHCLFAAQVGVAGNCTIGDWCVFQGQAGLAQNLTIGDRVTVLAKTGVSHDLESGKRYFGIPAQEARVAFKDLAMLRSLKRKQEE